jgi:hypothetical protein
MTVLVTRIVRRERAIGQLHVHEFPTGAATILDEVGHTAWTTQPLTGAVLFSLREDAEVALEMILSRTTAEEEVHSMSESNHGGREPWPPIVGQIMAAQISATHATMTDEDAPEYAIEATVATLASLMAVCMRDHHATTIAHNLQVVTHALKLHLAESMALNPRPGHKTGGAA